MTAAQLNLAFCIGTLLTEGDVFVDQFSESVLADPRRLALAERVEVRHDPAITARGASFRHMTRVEVHLADGTRHDETVAAPRGSEQAFASEADVVDKFRKLAGRTMGETQVSRINELVLSCDTLDDIGVLIDALAQPGATP
jgi:2-methylcitrate dehydratase PrpD